LKIIQINQFPLSATGMVQNDNISGNARVNPQPYLNQSGAFVTNNVNNNHQSMRLSIVIELTPQILCFTEHFGDYISLAKKELIKNGWIFALEGNKLYQTKAQIDSWSITERQGEVRSWRIASFGGRDARDSFTLTLDFLLPLGYWIESDPKTIFLEDYSIDNIVSDVSVIEVERCHRCVPRVHKCKDITPVQDIDSLFFRGEESLLAFTEGCEPTQRLIYVCNARDELWGRTDVDEYYALPLGDSSVIRGDFCFDTGMASELVEIVLTGTLNNPVITVNDIKFQILGEYSGCLIINGNLCVEYWEEGCPFVCNVHPLEIVPLAGGTRLKLKNGINKITVDTGDCEGCPTAGIRAQGITA